MSKYERKEYQETQVMRTVSPQRQTYNSNQNLSKFDSNLDCLLEDLQNSVSRPGSSLDYNGGGRSVETSRTVATDRSKSLNTVSNIKSSNPLTEYSSDDAYNYKSPDGKQQISGYKREKYMYKTTSEDISPEKIRAQNSINQLDNLLDDLQQVKQSSFLDTESLNTSGTDPKYGGSIKKRVVNRELQYGDTPTSHIRHRTIERDGSLQQKDIEYINEGTYTNTRTTRPTSPSVNSRTSTLSKQTKVGNIHEYPVEVIETVSPDIDPEVLAQLDPNLRPPGNTKVTTTIKTYTYEIPGSGDYPTNLNESNEQKYVYSPNKSITTPSKSFVYNTIENKENTLYQENTNYPPYQKPNPPGVLVKETITTRNYQPGYRIDKNPPSSNETYIYNETTTKNVDNRYSPIPPPLPNQNTYIIKETETNVRKNERPSPGKETYILKETHKTTVNDVVSPQYPHYPENTYPQHDKFSPGKETYIIKEVHNTTTTNDRPYSERGYPVYNPPDGRDPPNTYIIKETTNTTTNHSDGPYQNGRPQNDPPNKTIIYRHETHSTNNNYGPNNPKPFEVETFDPKNPPYEVKKHPNEPINIQYSYKSTSKTQNNFKGGYPPNGETETLLPKKFPTDDRPDGPPKKLDELMATIGNEPPTSPLNAGFIQHEHERAQQKKVESLKQRSSELEDSQKKEPPPKSKNIAGPPVYYPPGEMFLKNEEGGDAWRAQGAYARGSGKYQYEAESKSKSKMSSGATVVPVCLPLCCGLPCALL